MSDKTRKNIQRQQYKARRRARNFQARINLEKMKLDGAQLAKELADELLAAAKPKPVRSKSIVTGNSKRKTTFRRGFKKDLPYRLVSDTTALDAIPNPANMTDRQLEDYGRKILLKREMRSVEATVLRTGVQMDKASQYIQAVDFYNEEREILRRRHGVNYRSHLRTMARSELTNLRQTAKRFTIDTSRPVKPKLMPTMDAGQAADYISTRVSSMGRSLPGFGAAVQDINQAGILSSDQISDLLKNAPNSRNLTQAINAMGFDDFGIPSYGDHLRMIAQNSGPSYFSQQLAQKKQWMMEDEEIQKGARQRAFQLDKEAKLRAKAAAENSNRAQAALSAGFKDPTIETNYAKISASSANEVTQVIEKKAISTRTMERLMKSHTVAAGVAAGGLGLMYAFNRRRGEEQVGR